MLDGWTLAGGPSWKEDLTGPLAAGDAVRVVMPGQPRLSNGGGAVTLTDPGGTVVDRMSYTAAEVRTGRTLLSTG